MNKYRGKVSPTVQSKHQGKGCRYQSSGLRVISRSAVSKSAGSSSWVARLRRKNPGSRDSPCPQDCADKARVIELQAECDGAHVVVFQMGRNGNPIVEAAVGILIEKRISVKGSGRLRRGWPWLDSISRLPKTAIRLVVRPICADANIEGVGRPRAQRRILG